MTIEDGLAMFDPFFWGLRYPQQLDKLEGFGPDDYCVLDALVVAWSVSPEDCDVVVKF